MSGSIREIGEPHVGGHLVSSFFDGLGLDNRRGARRTRDSGERESDSAPYGKRLGPLCRACDDVWLLVDYHIDRPPHLRSIRRKMHPYDSGLARPDHLVVLDSPGDECPLSGNRLTQVVQLVALLLRAPLDPDAFKSRGDVETDPYVVANANVMLLSIVRV